MGIILKQGIANTIITYTGIVIGFINIIIIQPYFLTPEEVGLIRVLFSFSALIAIFAPLGITNITVKYFPLFRNKDKRHYGYFGFMLLFPLVGLLVTASILFLCSDWIIERYSKESKLFIEYLYYIYPLSFLLSIVAVLNAYCSSIFKSSVPVFVNDVLIRILSVLLFTVYFLKWINREQMVLLFVSIYGFQLLVMIFYVLLIDKPGLIISRKYFRERKVKSMIFYGLLLSLAAISSYGIKYIDTLILAGSNIPLEIVGVYAIVAFIPSIIEAPFLAIDKIAGPKVADAWVKNDKITIREIYYRSTKYLTLIGGLFFLGITLNIDSLLQILPAAYSRGINIVYILSIGAFFNMATGLNNSIIFSSKYYILGVIFLLVMLLITVIGNLILIPKLGIEGAALATVFGSIVYNILKFIFIWKNFKMQPFNKTTLKIALLILFCFIVCYFIPKANNPILAILFRSFVITIIYVIGTYFLKIVSELEGYVLFRKNKTSN